MWRSGMRPAGTAAAPARRAQARGGRPARSGQTLPKQAKTSYGLGIRWDDGWDGMAHDGNADEDEDVNILWMIQKPSKAQESLHNIAHCPWTSDALLDQSFVIPRLLQHVCRTHQRSHCQMNPQTGHCRAPRAEPPLHPRMEGQGGPA